MKTGTITYNVRERGRQHRGQNGNFDTITMRDSSGFASFDTNLTIRRMAIGN